MVDKDSQRSQRISLDPAFNRECYIYFEQDKGSTNSKPKRDANSFEALCEKGLYFIHYKNWQKAYETFEKIIELHHANERVWNNKGASIGKLENFNEALNCYYEAVRINPRYKLAYYNIGWTLIMLGMFKESIKVLDMVIGLDGEKTRKWSERGLSLKGVSFYELGNYNEAIDSFERALRINKNSRIAKYGKYLCYSAIGIDTIARGHNTLYKKLLKKELKEENSILFDMRKNFQ